jgi:hypothetical protein
MVQKLPPSGGTLFCNAMTEEQCCMASHHMFHRFLTLTFTKIARSGFEFLFNGKGGQKKGHN